MADDFASFLDLHYGLDDMLYADVENQDSIHQLSKGLKAVLFCDCIPAPFLCCRQILWILTNGM